MNFRSIKYFICVVLALSIAACKKDAPVEVDVGYDYMPGTVGSWIIYDVDSIVFDLFETRIDTYSYQIREVVESIYLDAQNRETMRIERYKRDSVTGTWKIKDVWAANKLSTRFEKVEENVRFVKLVFPVKTGQIWDGNISNVNERWNYEYTEAGVPKNINGLYFPLCLTVKQKVEDLDGLEKFDFVEIYAKNVGMIYKKAVELTKGNVQALWNDSTEVNGYDLTMEVNSYGN